ncbi:MAG TPA: TIM barrel protein [Puia sp.]|nr:TIM barrel protein [Puia sp.]
MNYLNRRKFIRRTAFGASAVFATAQMPSLLKAEGTSRFIDHPIGFQSFSVRDLIGKDFSATLRMMAGLGYQQVEMCSPAGYVSSGFGPLTSLKGAEMKKIIEDAGLHCPSCHFTFGELTDKLDDRIAFAKDLGLSQMICSSFWLAQTATLKDYLDSVDKLNKIAEKIARAGMETGFHNHDMEFKLLDGQLIYDALMSHFDPSLVKMQFQTEVINLGFKAADYFNKYPGRFISAHLSDWTADKKQVPIGQGIIDWKTFFAAAKTGGVKNFFVEMDLGTMTASADYIKSL